MKPSTIENAWAKNISSLLEQLGSNRDKGLSNKQTKERLTTYGSNTFGQGISHSTLLTFLHQFTSPLIIILLVAAGVTLYFEDVIDVLFILLAVVTSVGLGFYQEYKAERATAALKSYIEERVRFLRDGREMEAEAKLTVPGDIVLLRAGERVPADGRIIESHELAIDESILTGESLPVSKRTGELAEASLLPERSNMVFGGTYVAEGQGKVLIIATGIETEFGQIAQSVLTQKSEKTPLQKAVSLIGWVITVITLLLVGLVYLLGMARGMEHLDIFLLGVAIAVGAIPEALPPGLTAILAVGVERIAKSRGIVRSLLAAETLGSTNVIITDKTGTLTTGRLELVEILSVTSVLAGVPSVSESKKEILAYAVTNTATIISDSGKSPKKWKVTGRHLDVGIVNAAIKQGIDVVTILKNTKPVKLFSSAHKYSIYESEGKEIVLGAPDILLRHAKLSTVDHQKMVGVLEKESGSGKRLLGVGIKKPGDSNDLTIEFIGLLLFYDPLRPKMKEAIANIESAGCRVIMATGDLLGTAIAVAKSLGWPESDKHVLTGEDMGNMTDEELQDALTRVRIFARMTPNDKFRLIEMLEAEGNVVAMLGDGVNDAPSLKRASIGVAVGSGTDVAKGVADLVLLDDDFHTIKAAIEEGRLIIANIRKTFVYLMSNGFDEIVLLGGSLALGLTLPLTPLQVIWVNFFTGGIPAIAYAFDQQKTFRHKKEPAILNREVVTLTFGIGIISSAALLGLHYLTIKFGFDSALGRSFLFACFSSYILFVAVSFRNLHKPLFTYPMFENHILNFGIGLGVCLMLLTIYLPFFQNLFGTVALPLSWLFLVVLWIVANIALVELAKWIIVYRDDEHTHIPTHTISR